MDQNQEIISELKKLNQKIETISNNNRFFIFNTSPFKFTLFNFLGGTFHALGTLFGTLIIASALVYVFAQFNLTSSISKWIETTMSQVNWQKVVVPQNTTVQ